MSNQPTIEQLAVERDQLAGAVLGLMRLTTAHPILQAGAELGIARYAMLSEEIARRGEPVQQGRLLEVR